MQDHDNRLPTILGQEGLFWTFLTSSGRIKAAVTYPATLSPNHSSIQVRQGPCQALHLHR